MTELLDEGSVREFVEEAREHIVALNRDLLELEERGSDEPAEIVNSAFRAIHTVKGNSGMLGLEAINGLSHVMEDVLSEVRKGEAVVSGQLASALFQSLDFLSEMIEALAAGETRPRDVSGAIAGLDAALAGGRSKGKPEGAGSTEKKQGLGSERPEGGPEHGVERRDRDVGHGPPEVEAVHGGRLLKLREDDVGGASQEVIPVVAEHPAGGVVDHHHLARAREDENGVPHLIQDRPARSERALERRMKQARLDAGNGCGRRPLPRGAGLLGHVVPVSFGTSFLRDPDGIVSSFVAVRLGASASPGEGPVGTMLRLGPEALSTTELAAVLLGPKDTRGIAILVEGRLRSLARMSVRELSALPGIGKRTAARLLAAIEFGRRWAVEQKPATRKFRCGRDLFDHYHLALRDQKKEHFICVLLDQKNRFIRDEAISVGGLTSSRVHIGEAFRSALRESATAVAFVHNHPSGDPRPSEEDEVLTDRLAKAAGLVGVRLLDHVIIGEKSFYSFFEEGRF